MNLNSKLFIKISTEMKTKLEKIAEENELNLSAFIRLVLKSVIVGDVKFLKQ